ncbi:MAG: hypothetical protein H0W40_12855 [Methylibium sp.]|uniref:hypothetical protein n=1 Tax=Methylibium sp. TaxID=2067992 RepID=UPI0017A925AD|nr:hypothetical protein [Methylibium sp.]MBA3598245.1 hypothetical protein [Methylibium sp.]
MRGVLRIVLAWLLVLALPVQGVAAQAMLFCGPMHSTAAFGSATPTVAATHHDHALHEHGASPAAVVTEAHAHGAMNAHAPQQADPSNAEPQASGEETSTQPLPSAEMSSATCSVCASCCSMAAIATALVVPDTLSFSPVYTLSPFEPHASLAAGGLERPPKPRLA